MKIGESQHQPANHHLSSAKPRVVGSFLGHYETAPSFHEAVFREMVEVDTVHIVCVFFFWGGFVYFNHGQKTQTSNKTSKMKKVDQVSL